MTPRWRGRLRFAWKAALSLAVLYAGWAAAAVWLEGWAALAPPADETSTSGRRPAETLRLPGLAEPRGGYWRFAGFPWVMELAGEPQPAPPDPELFLGRFRAENADNGGMLDAGQAESLRRLSWLGASESPLSGGRTLWQIAIGPTRVALSLRDGRDKVRVLAGMLTRKDPASGRWTTFALLPKAAGAPASEPLIPDSAAPNRLAARCDAQGATVFEIAEVDDRAFLGVRGAADELESAGFREFRRQAVSGRDVSYYRGPCVRGRPVLVIATTGG